MVALGLISVGVGERRNGTVERTASSKIAADQRRVTRFRVPACERPATHLTILGQLPGGHPFEPDGGLHVTELSEIEVAPVLVRGPAEEQVTGRLKQALAADNPLAMRVIFTLAKERLQDGRAGLFLLQQEEVIAPGHHQ
jgi:hypothetical protein